jgi:hypothetical protein
MDCCVDFDLILRRRDLFEKVVLPKGGEEEGKLRL